MSLVVTTPPTAELVTLAESRAHCRLDTNDEDGLLAGYLLASREHVETHTQRALSPRTYTLRLDRRWPKIVVGGEERVGIRLPRPPLQSVTSVTYIDAAGAVQTLAPSLYQALRVGDPVCDGLIVPAPGVTWPPTRDQLEAVTIVFVAGYGGSGPPLPEPIRHAVLLLTAHLYENREPVNIGNITTELPFSVDALLFPWRVLG